MSRRAFSAAAAATAVLGTAVTIHNGLAFPVPGGCDAFAPFTPQ